jgi:hypothetical protein
MPQTYTDPTTHEVHEFPDDATPQEIDAATRPKAPTKPGPFKTIADAIYPPAPRPPEGYFKPGLRAAEAIVSAPQQAVEHLTGYGSGETLGPAMEKFHDWMAWKPGPGVPTREEYGDLGRLAARILTDPLTYAGGISPALRAVRGVAAGAKVALEIEAAARVADNLELPATQLLKPAAEAHPPFPGAPGPAPEYVAQQSLRGTPWMGAPRAVEQAEDVIRARSAVNDFHAVNQTQSPLPPPISGGSKGPLGGETSALWNWIGEKTAPVTGWKPEDWTIAAAKFKANVGTVFTPQDVARGIPAAQNIVHEAYAAQDAAHLIVQDIGKKLVDIYKPFKGDEASIMDIHRLLDGVPTKGTVTPELAGAAARVRNVFDTLADMAGLPKQSRLADYFPHLRDEISSVLQLKIGKEGQAIVKNIPQDFKVFFQKPRTLPGDETIDYGLKAVQGYLGAAAKRIAMKGGTLSDGRPVGGFLNRVTDHFNNLPDVPELRSYFEEYIKDLTYGRQAVRSVLSPQVVQTLKQVQFLRTIGVNLMTPVQNIMQTMNTLAKTDIRSWGAAWYDIVKNPELMAKAQASGLVDQGYSHTDLLNLSSPNAIESLISKGADKAALLFKRSEEVNRMHAFAAGYRDAIRSGLPEDSAIAHAKDIVNQTQFRFGPENLPGWLRQQGGAGSLIGQYKSYQLNQLMFLKNLMVHDPKGAAKWLTAGLLLGGPDVYGQSTGHAIRQMASNAFGGDPKDYRYRGVLGSMGMWVGNQMGLGALPAEDMQGLAFLLPGPAVGHVLSMASAASGKDFSAQGLFRGNFGKELTPEQRATQTTTSFPVGGVQLNRLRQAIVMGRSQGANFQQPETTGQAYGLEPPSGRGTVPYSVGEIARKAAGTPSEASQTAHAQQQRVAEDVQAYKDLVRKKADAIKRGDADAVRELNKQGIQQFGRIPAIRPSDVKSSVQGSRRTGIERAVKSAPKPIRQRERKEAED